MLSEWEWAEKGMDRAANVKVESFDMCNCRRARGPGSIFKDPVLGEPSSRESRFPEAHRDRGSGTNVLYFKGSVW